MNNLVNGLFKRNGILGLGKDFNRKMSGVVFISKPAFGKKLQDSILTRCKETGWTRLSHRVGAIGKKLGMITTYIDGTQYPCTVLQIPNNQVTQIKHKVNDGVDAIQVGADEIKLKNLTKQLKGHFARADVPPKRILMEFQVTRNAMVNVGTEITAKHFVPGQLINVQGITRGKGFAGGMKRWNFRGQPASHGVSVTHRSIGSTGCRQTPGRVFKGKKMPGRLGGEKCTEQNLQILRVNTELNCIMVKGAVPGGENSYVKITDSRSNKWKKAPPFPTYYPKEGELDEELVISKGEIVVKEQYQKQISTQLISNDNYTEIMEKVNKSNLDRKANIKEELKEKKIKRNETFKKVQERETEQKEQSRVFREQRKSLRNQDLQKSNS